MEKRQEIPAIPSDHRRSDDIRKGQVTINVSLCSDSEQQYEEQSKRKRRHKKRSNVEVSSTTPIHVHSCDWKDMLYVTNSRLKKRPSDINQTTFLHNNRPRTTTTKCGVWIEYNLKKRECCRFVASSRFSTRCGCGMTFEQHSPTVKELFQSENFVTLSKTDFETQNESDVYEEIKSTNRESNRSNRWTIVNNTETKPTDAYGTIIFEGSAHQSRAQFVRTRFDTEPATISYLLQEVWKLPQPKLIITIHGGLTNFDMLPKLARTFRKGILKAARSTDAWIITSGVNTGVVPHFATALEDLGPGVKSRTQVTAIGVAPWGMLKKRNHFVGKDLTVHYTANRFSRSRLFDLNDRHSYFIFADNGTVGRCGSEIILRKRLEAYFAQQKSLSIPVVCVVLEGGAFTIKVVEDYITSTARIPVVVCDGSGRAADLLAFTHHSICREGKLSESVRNQLMLLVKMVFSCAENNADRIVQQLIHCAQQKNLMTVFSLGEQQQDMDHAIFTALLKGQNLSAPDQLQLALAWNRADIARTEIFTLGTEWCKEDLHNAMMEALILNRTDFVQLLLDNGVSMQRFLTYGRLEHLYNSDRGPPNTLRSKMGITLKEHDKIRLIDVGHTMEDLMGHAYKSNYTKEDFKAKYLVYTHRMQYEYRNGNYGRPQPKNFKKYRDTDHVRNDLLHTARISIFSIFGRPRGDHDENDELLNEDDDSLDFTFKYPYSELLIWATLTKRQSMAMLMWKHGEEAMAKSLIACRLYDSLAHDASENYLELEICEELRKNSEDFRRLSIELLQYCSEQDKDITLQLLTYELTNWGNETCLSLAALDKNRQFLAHPCCQLLLSDLWHGGLHIRYNANLKVLASLLVPVGIFMMEYKTKEELMLQPHTLAEHLEENSDSDTSLDSDTSYSASTTSESDDVSYQDKIVRRRGNTETNEPVSLNPEQLMRCHSRFPHQKECMTNGNRITTRQLEARPLRSLGLDSSLDLHNVDEETPRRHTDVCKDREKTKKTQHTISWRRKIREFYSAPITTFWLWSLSFYIFLIGLSYTLLIKTDRNPTWIEWYLVMYVVVWMMELLRKLVMIVMIDRKQKVWRKVVLYFGNYRNGILLIATVTYVIAFCIRCNPSSRMTGRVMLVCNSVLWSLKLLDYMRVFRHLGPYITMAAEMIPRMLPILAMLFVSLLSFGLVRESVTYPFENWDWLLVRNIFYKPYFMLYGEVYAPEIDTCGDEIWDAHIEQDISFGSDSLNITGKGCVPGHFIAPLFMTVFMLIANVLLMNTMVACCTYVFEHNVDNTHEIWLFERYSQVMEYDSTPFIPPPFTIFYHIFWLLRWLQVRKFSRKNLLDASLKLFLTDEHIEKIYSFEKDCVEDMVTEKDIHRQSSTDDHTNHTTERSDQIVNRLNIIENIVKTDLRNLNLHLNSIEARHMEEINELKLMNCQLQQLLRCRMKNTLLEQQESEYSATSQDSIGLYQKKLFPESLHTSPHARHPSSPKLTIVEKPSFLPSIVDGVIDVEDNSRKTKDDDAFTTQQQGKQLLSNDNTDETRTQPTSTYTRPTSLEFPYSIDSQVHNGCTSIADRVCVDWRLNNNPSHYHYEHEPVYIEEDASYLSEYGIIHSD